MGSTQKQSIQVATTQALTGSYVVGDEKSQISVYGEDVGSLAVSYTTGATETGTACQFKLEFSHDGTNWFQQQFLSESGGTISYTDVEHSFGGGAGDTEYKALYNFQIIAKYMRVSFKESGSPGNAGSVDADLTLGAGVASSSVLSGL